jgi:hypothetical protein
MGEHRSRLGVGLVTCVAACWVGGATTAATNAAGWGNPVVIGLLIAGAFCLVGAWVLLRGRERVAISEGHRDDVRKSLVCLRRAIENGEPCTYGDTDEDAKALRLHCPWLVQELDGWDSVVERRTAANMGLLDYMETAASAAGLAEPTSHPTRIVDWLHAQIARRAAHDALNQPIELLWKGWQSTGEVSPSGTDKPWLDIPKGEDEPVEEWRERVTTLTDRVDSFALKARESPHARKLANVYVTLDDVRPSLLAALRHAEKKDSYRAVDGCPTCEVNRR